MFITWFLISIHAPHTGRDFHGFFSFHAHNYFNPRAPYGARLLRKVLVFLDIQFQSTRPIRGATLTPSACSQRSYFNPRAPYGARPAEGPVRQDRGTDFNPRAPYGARRWAPFSGGPGRYFNPRAPYGARPPWHCALGRSPPISIHAPHTGRDRHCCIQRKPQSAFQSTRPIRGATTVYAFCQGRLCISIHAPHTGRDTPSWSFTPPWCLFQSTRPIRGATRRRLCTLTPGSYFNPRAPYGARHAAATGITLPMLISIHAPHTGRDLPTASIPARPQLHFNPRAPYGARPDAQSCIVQEERFQSTRPIRGATAKPRLLAP